MSSCCATEASTGAGGTSPASSARPGHLIVSRSIAKPSRVASPRRRPTISTSSLVSVRSEEHTSELQSLMRISYAVFCLKKKTTTTQQENKYTQKKSNTKNEADKREH